MVLISYYLKPEQTTLPLIHGTLAVATAGRLAT